MTQGFLVLRVPWGLFGGSSQQIRLEEPGEDVALCPGSVPLVFSFNEDPPFIDGRRDSAEIQSGIRTREGEPQFLWALPVPLRADDTQSLRATSWSEDASLHYPGAVSRPLQRTGSDDETERGFPWLQFLLVLVGRMRDFEDALAASHVPWLFVLERWMENEKNQDPQMDVIVRHARSHRACWSDIVDRPRHVLSRRREMVPLGRVEELDTRCMAWLSRQPGSAIPERAGARQRILALSRFENVNTLENRVHRDLLERSSAAAREYLHANKGRSRNALGVITTRYALVEQYGRECRHLAAEMARYGVNREHGTVQPNFVLLHDERYRHVWQAWRQIVNRERVLDDLWRWQRGAWSEFCKAACVVALLATPGNAVKIIAASPLFFRREHRRGQWLVHDDPMVTLADRSEGWVVEVLSGNSADVPMFLREMGASVWLRIADMEGSQHRYIVVWAIHGPGKPPDLGALVESAGEAVRLVARDASQARLHGGIVLQALIDGAAGPTSRNAVGIAGLAFGPWEHQLINGLDHLGGKLIAFIKDRR